jgi:hypothetical protein
MGKTTLKDFGWAVFMRTVAWNTLHNTAAALGWGLASYRKPSRLGGLRSIRNLKRRRDLVITPLEAMQLVALVRATAKLGGCMAEVGVYAGGSARLIRENDATRPLHLFDTFTGLPELADADTPVRCDLFREGQYACSLEDVRHYLGDCQKVYFHQGVFPGTGATVQSEGFSFVHSDADLYSSTRAVLEFFYPRMLPGGIILSHDFDSAPGVHEAFVKYFNDLPEPVIELGGDQGMIVKL